MGFESNSPQRVKRGNYLALPYRVVRDGAALDVSGYHQITAHLFLSTNTPVWTGTLTDGAGGDPGSGNGGVVFGVDGSGDGTDGIIAVIVDTHQPLGTYTLQVEGESVEDTTEEIASEPITIEFNSHDRA